MQCTCGGETRVLESRKVADGLRRRRQCLICKTRFTTVERRDTVPAPKVEPKPKPIKPAKPISAVKARRQIEDRTLDREYDYLDIEDRYRW